MEGDVKSINDRLPTEHRFPALSPLPPPLPNTQRNVGGLPSVFFLLAFEPHSIIARSNSSQARRKQHITRQNSDRIVANAQASISSTKYPAISRRIENDWPMLMPTANAALPSFPPYTRGQSAECSR